jgi:hypothetical protein
LATELPTLRLDAAGATVRGISAMILDSLFMVLQLLLDFIDCMTDSDHQVRSLVMPNKLMAMLSFSQDFNFVVFGGRQINDDLDRNQSFEEMQQLFSFFTNLLLVFFADVPVSGGDDNLHR